jgi:hypothetical protein
LTRRLAASGCATTASGTPDVDRPKSRWKAWTPAVEPEAPEYSVGEVCGQIAELDPRHRRALLMREFEGRSYDEISAELRVTEPAVQAILVRARRTLRDELELGIACSQARRISLRHRSGVATGRRAASIAAARPQMHRLRHVRRGAVAYVDRPPPLAADAAVQEDRRARLRDDRRSRRHERRRGGALAAKVLALTAIGTSAVGVTARQVDAPAEHVDADPGQTATVPTVETVTAAADDADATSAGDPPAATDDQPAPAAGGNEDPNGHGDERGVGRGGTPPGHGGPSPDELGPPGPAATQARERARESRS